MKRREFITLLGGAVATWSLAARAQPNRMRRVGIIDDAPAWKYFRQALRDLGYTEGHNITFDYRIAEGSPERLAAAAAELVRLPVDVIAVYGTPASRAAKASTTSIPIVAISVGEPVRIGLVKSLARPGGNVTGNTNIGPDLGPKRLQLIKELIPTVSRVAFLWNPDNASNKAIFDELRIAAPALGLNLISVEVRSSNDFEQAFTTIVNERAHAMLMTNDPLHQRSIVGIINFLTRARLPAIFQTSENVVAGGLMSYGTSFPDLFRHGASYVHKILQGEKPEDLPIQQPTRFELVINLKAAKAIGLQMPESFLLRADEVIE